MANRDSDPPVNTALARRLSTQVHDVTILPRDPAHRSYSMRCSCGEELLTRDKGTAILHAFDHLKRVLMWNGREIQRMEFSWTDEVPHV